MAELPLLAVRVELSENQMQELLVYLRRYLDRLGHQARFGSSEAQDVKYYVNLLQAHLNKARSQRAVM